MRQLRALENMLDLVTAVIKNCCFIFFIGFDRFYFEQSTQLDKIFVCDIYNKIILASDTKPVETQLSELCCDVVDVYTDISSIYGYAIKSSSMNYFSSLHPSVILQRISGNNNKEIIFMSLDDQFIFPGFCFFLQHK